MLFFNKNRSSDVEMRLRIYRREQCKYTKMYLYRRQTGAETETETETEAGARSLTLTDESFTESHSADGTNVCKKTQTKS